MTSPTFITPGFAVTSSMREADFAAAAKMGFKSIICNLPDGENEQDLTSAQAAKLAWQHGLALRYIPADKMELFSASTVDPMEDALRTLDGPVLAYCRSGMRSAIVWAAASARHGSVPCVLAALLQAGFDFDFLEEDLVEQANAKRWPATVPALDCSEAKHAKDTNENEAPSPVAT